MKASKIIVFILSFAATMGHSVKSAASVVGLEGDRMTWEGAVTAPAGAVAFSPTSMGMAEKTRSAFPTHHPVLVILVEFSDQGAVGSTEADWENAFFGAARSVRDYYEEVSYGQLLMTPASESFGTADNGVIGWLAIGYDHPNTASDSGLANMQVARDALIAADPYIDYSLYDTDGNRAIDFTELSLVIILAGYESSYSGSYAPSVWGHRFVLLFPIVPPVLDRVRLAALFWGGGYMQYGEWHQHGPNDGHMATIGIMVHEMGHDLGLPDLYDVSVADGSEGIGEWGVMGNGSWGTAGGWQGSSPTHMCAWSKEFLGFLSPVSVSEGTGLLLPDVATSGIAYRVDTIDSDQYFLVENRQPVGYDRGLPMHSGGIIIWHIDNSAGSLLLNTVNADENHKRVDVEEAEDGFVGYSELDNEDNRGDQRDLFYSGNNTQFDDLTTPGAMLYGDVYSGVSISNVSAPGNPMTLDVSYDEPVDGDGDGHYPLADCDDNDPSVYPGAPGDVPGDGVDTNCDGDDACFVATAAFGTELEPRIAVLKSFRDSWLAKSPAGKALVRSYYRCSPPIADYIAQRSWMRTIVRILLLPLIGLVSFFV